MAATVVKALSCAIPARPAVRAQPFGGSGGGLPETGGVTAESWTDPWVDTPSVGVAPSYNGGVKLYAYADLHQGLHAGIGMAAGRNTQFGNMASTSLAPRRAAR